jgi:hypothetical protein
LNGADAFDFTGEAMLIAIEIGVQTPDELDRDALLTIFPYRQALLTVVKGGLNIHRHGVGLVANAAISVSFEIESINE